MPEYEKTQSGIMVPKGSIDGLVNLLTGLGTGLSKRSGNTFQYDGLNDYAQYEAAYQSNWIARQIVDIPAEDMTREWRTIKSDGAEDIAAEEQKLCLQQEVQDAVSWARLFGGGGILMLTGQDLTKPLRVNQIKKGDLERILVFDKWEMQPQTLNTWDVLAPNYLMPEYYTIQGGTTSIHHSHFARFNGTRLPRRQMAYTQGWGDSELRKCLEDLMDTVASKNGIAELMQEANVDVIKRENLFEDLASDEEASIEKQYQLTRLMKGNLKMLLMDKEGEEYERNTLAMGGVAQVIEVFMTWISGAADIPVTRLFGTSAKGMNATGEGDMRNYYDSIRSKQTSQLVKPMRIIDEVLVRSALGKFPDDFDYEWNPLFQPNNLEIAQVENLQKDTDIGYRDAGIISNSQIMRNLQASEKYQFDDEQINDLEEAEKDNPFEFGGENGSDNE